MQIKTYNSLTDFQKNEIVKLWNKEYPSNLIYKSIDEFDEYLSKLIDPEYFIVSSDNDILGWAVVFFREQEIWFAIILDSKVQSKGLGTKLLKELKVKYNTLNGWVVDHDNFSKIDGSNYKSPMQFYLKNNFFICENVRIENEKISAVKIRWNGQF